MKHGDTVKRKAVLGNLDSLYVERMRREDLDKEWRDKKDELALEELGKIDGRGHVTTRASTRSL